MEITAAQVKELREITGAGMMECKKALLETSGDIDKAIDLMRKAGVAKAAKKAGRVAAEGVVMVEVATDQPVAIMVEINCETDFVTKSDDFRAFTPAVAQCALRNQPADLEALLALPLEPGGESVESRRQALIAKIGENITVRRYVLLKSAGGVIGQYRHGQRIGVLVDMEGGNAELAKDIAMHIAASRPVCIGEDQVPAELIEKEREIFRAQAAQSGKPADIIEKMVNGRIQKFLQEVTLLGQPFVKDPDTTVAKLLAQNKAKVRNFIRFEVGEGIEKKSENFAEEVMAQVRNSGG